MASKTLGQKIKEARENKYLNQIELGKLIGISNKTISAYEADRISPSIDLLIKIANVLEVDLNYFADDQLLFINDKGGNYVSSETSKINAMYEILKKLESNSK